VTHTHSTHTRTHTQTHTHTHTRHTPWTIDRSVAEAATDTTQHSQGTNTHERDSILRSQKASGRRQTLHRATTGIGRCYSLHQISQSGKYGLGGGMNVRALCVCLCVCARARAHVCMYCYVDIISNFDVT